MSDKNGKIADIIIPQKYEKYIFSTFFLHKKGDTIRDYKREPVGFLFMMFSDADEMERTLIQEYQCDWVKIEDTI